MITFPPSSRRLEGQWTRHALVPDAAQVGVMSHSEMDALTHTIPLLSSEPPSLTPFPIQLWECWDQDFILTAVGLGKLLGDSSLGKSQEKRPIIPMVGSSTPCLLTLKQGFPTPGAQTGVVRSLVATSPHSRRRAAGWRESTRSFICICGCSPSLALLPELLPSDQQQR